MNTETIRSLFIPTISQSCQDDGNLALYAALFQTMLEDFTAGREKLVYPLGGENPWEMLYSLGLNALAYGLDRGLMLANRVAEARP